MGYRVQDQEVKDILDTTETTFGAFISAAEIIIDKTLVASGVITDTTQLKEIERWLAAHLFSIKEPEIKSVKTGQTTADFFTGGDAQANGTSLALQTTRYGRQVMMLDTSGELAQLGMREASCETIDAVSKAVFP
jgi:hypothetical protein